MLNFFNKNELYQKFKEFRSFATLIFLITITVIIISIYEKFKFNQKDRLQNLLQNTYLIKTLKSLSGNLEPRYERLNYKIRSGESFESILNEI